MIEVSSTKPEGFNPLFEVAGTFIEVGDEILLMHRHPDKPYGEKWGLPAGKLEKGETPHQAAAREIEEETGIQLTTLRSLGPLYVRIEYDFIFHLFAIRLNEKPQVLHEADAHIDFQWISPKKATTLPLIVGGHETFEFYLAHKNLMPS